MGALPPGHRAEPGHQAKWLWRTLRAAELAGLDPAQVLTGAIAERDLAGARDIAAVIDARIRHRLGSLVPLPAGPWFAQVPAIADPGRRAYLAEIATMMDARKDRIGEHAVEHPQPWAISALGPAPGHPLDRLEWQRRASAISAWRELTDWEHATRAQRHLAVAADTELRRRHPGQHFPLLRSAEPQPALSPERDELTLTTGEKPAETDQRLKDLTAAPPRIR
jgi:hypothetical protein